VRDHASVTEVESSSCRAVFGAAVTFDSTALVHLGRRHFCGPARAAQM
jgi:hypothetical protein